MRLLTDEHISPEVAVMLSRQGVDAVSVVDWRRGELRPAADEVVLAAAREQGYVLVTYDRRTIPPLLRLWAETELHHAGVVFVTPTAFPPADRGGLSALAISHGHLDWTDAVVYLVRSSG